MTTKKTAAQSAGKKEARPAAAPGSEKSEAMAKMAVRPSVNAAAVMVSYGNASGPVEPFAPGELAKRGSLYVTRPSLFDFIGTRAELEAGAGELFALVAAGTVRISIGQTYPLGEVERAHSDLEGRRTTGSTLLLP